jgi:TonB-linked SusC/RagA family outer membrane protein
MTHRIRWLLAALVGVALAAPAAGAQGTGTITGTVTDAQSQRPVAEVQVVVLGTNLGARTDAQGLYRLTNVPAGTAQLRVSRIGYQLTTRTVTVPAGGTVTADFSVTASTTVLSTVTITASGQEQLRRENGASVATVSVDSIPKAPIQNFADLITGRASGVTIQHSTGTTGMGSRVRIRGSNSVSLNNEPLLIIDGVRIDNEPQSNAIDVGGQAPSRLNDLNPEDIEDIEIVKGPAAAALYGTAAANGVIQITTKRGRAGAPRWAAYAEYGTLNENNDFPANYGGWTTPGLYNFPGNPADPTNPTCNLFYESLGYCTIDSLNAFNTIERSGAFRTGHRQKLGASVSGGAQNALYFLSADNEREAGIYRTSNLDRLNLRANVDMRPGEKFDARVSTGWTQSNLQLPQNDNNYYGVISNGLAGWQADGPTQGFNPIPPSEFEQIDTRQELRRFTGGATANWRPLSWLSANATLGIDAVNRNDLETLQPNIIDFGNDWLGHRTAAHADVINTTSNYAVTARWSPTLSIQTTSQAGYQYQRAQYHSSFGFGRKLTSGSGSLGGVVSDLAVGENTVDNKTAGGFLSEQVAWNDKLYVTATLRGDKNSAFGKNLGFVTYPSLSLSYVAIDNGELLNQLRLRAAYGESGLRPGVLDAIQYYTPVTARLDSAEQSAITVGNLSNPDLKPEKTGELEVGFDATVWRNLANIELTYYQKRSRDALIAVPLPQSLGGPATRFENIGAVRNEGVELTVSATPLERENYVLGLTLNGSWNRNKLTSLGGQEPIVFGLNGSQRHIEDYPLGGYWGTTVDSVHVQSDGSIGVNDVFFSTDSADVRYLGQPLPTRQLSLGGDLQLFKWVRVTTLFEHRGGNKLFNSSEQFRCLPFVATCRGLNDITAPVAERANAMADAVSQGSFYGGYVEDASFTKWRELAVTLTVPERYVSRLRARGASISFAGRNLATWTKYSGVDPEVNYSGQSNFDTADFLTQPQVRYFTARLNFTF